MKNQHFYEAVDLRQADSKINGIVLIYTIPGGLRARRLDGRSVDLLYDDDQPGTFIDDVPNGVVEVLTNEGRVILTELRLTNWEDSLEPFFPDIPEFKTDDELQRYFHRLMRDS